MHSAMEQKRYWMWSRRKLGERGLSSQIPLISVGSSYSSSKSWEEQAFAEDSAGHLGGCIWPPRSYSCSFCRREFRSAQALGGHMNVHRRDRARLKQSPTPAGEPLENRQHHHLLTPACMPPPQTGSPVYNSNPKPNPNCGVVESPLSPKASAASTQENLSGHTSISPSYSACVVRDDLKESLIFSTSTGPPKNSLTVGLFTIPELKLGRESLRLRELGFRARRDHPDEEEDIEAISRKKRRTDPTFALFVKPSSGDLQQVQSEVLMKFSPRPVEELDLELRLGDPPVVK